MDTVVLPVLNPDRSLDEALWRMREADRSAVLVVRKSNEKYGLAYIGSVRRAQAKGKTTLGQIEDMHAVLVMDPVGATRYNLDLQNLHRTRNEAERYLDAINTMYSVVSAAPDNATLVTRHEGQTALINQYNNFECDGPEQHFFPEPAVTPGQECPECAPPKGKIIKI